MSSSQDHILGFSEEETQAMANWDLPGFEEANFEDTLNESYERLNRSDKDDKAMLSKAREKRHNEFKTKSQEREHYRAQIANAPVNAARENLNKLIGHRTKRLNKLVEDEMTDLVEQVTKWKDLGFGRATMKNNIRACAYDELLGQKAFDIVDEMVSDDALSTIGFST